MDFERSFEGRKKALLRKLAPKKESAAGTSYERQVAKLLISQSGSLPDLLSRLKATKEEVPQGEAKQIIARLIAKVESLIAEKWLEQ